MSLRWLSPVQTLTHSLFLHSASNIYCTIFVPICSELNGVFGFDGRLVGLPCIACIIGIGICYECMKIENGRNWSGMGCRRLAFSSKAAHIYFFMHRRIPRGKNRYLRAIQKQLVSNSFEPPCWKSSCVPSSPISSVRMRCRLHFSWADVAA
jgi:hypothetical protein